MLKNAFVRVMEGRRCSKCKQQIAHACYQRHVADCKVKVGTEDDDVQFIKAVVNSCTPLGYVVKKEETSPTPSCSTQIEPLSATSISCVESIRRKVLKRDLSCEEDVYYKHRKILFEMCDSGLEDMYKILTERLHTLIQSCGSQARNTQRLGPRLLLSSGGSKAHGDPTSWNTTQRSTNEQTEESEETNNTTLESANMEDESAVHYSLEYLWRITLKALQYLPGEWKNDGSLETSTSKIPSKRMSSADFWGAQSLRYLIGLFNCSYEAQRIFLKIFFSGQKWFAVRKLKLRADLSSEMIQKCCVELEQYELLKKGSTEDFCRQIGDISLENCLRMLSSSDLTKLCRKFKIRSTNKIDGMVAKLCNVAVSQRSIFNNTLESAIKDQALLMLGNVYRIQADCFSLMHSIFTIYSPINMDTAVLVDQPGLNLARQLLYDRLQLDTMIGRLSLADDEISLVDIYANYDELKDYIGAKQLEADMLAGFRKADNHKSMDKYYLRARDRLLSDYFGEDEKMIIYRSLPFHLRAFTPPAVLTRCLVHYAKWLQRQSSYVEAASLLCFLIDTVDVRLFCTITCIGEWFDRLALIYDVHLKDKEEARKICFMGITGGILSEVDKLGLQLRAQKLSDDDCHANFKLSPIEPKPVYVEGFVISKNLGDQRVNHFYIPTEADGSGHTDFHSCSVETVALHHFKHNCGFTEGLHAEGAIWHTIFGLLCYDVIFDRDIPNVWLSSMQTYPCDLNSPDFYINRREKFEIAFSEIAADVSHEWMSARVLQTLETHANEQNSEISWGLFRDYSHITGFLKCCTPSLILAVFRRLTSGYRQFRSGFPDLTVWNPDTRAIAVVEVKGPKDRLSNKQRLWLDAFARNGVESIVCHVTAKNCRLIQ